MGDLNPSLIAPMLAQVALGQLASFLNNSGLSNLHQVPAAITPTLPPAVPAIPPPAVPPAILPLNQDDISFDCEYPSIEEFLTALDMKDGGKRGLVKFIPRFELLGFLSIDDLLYVKNPEKTFKEECEMEVGTTSFILHNCQKEIKRLRAQMGL